jgi:formylglycine-generating enzyme required for sulfatase activity
MHDPDADAQPTTQLEAGTQTGGTPVRHVDVDTQTESQVCTEPESGIRPPSGCVPATDLDSRIDRKPATEPEPHAEIDGGDVSTDPGDDGDDRLLDLLEQWEERYDRGEDASPESLGVDDPALIEALRVRIGRQKRLYAFLKHTPTELLAESTDLPARPAAGVGVAAPTPEVGDAVPDGTGPETSPSYIGRYRVIRVLGEGGFGRVHLAHDAELDRDVAIKVPFPIEASRYLDVESYLEEARIIARLSHPNIVPVYDVGRTEDGRCYVVSKYMDGGDLANRLRHGRPTFAEAAELIAVLCDALHYTHTHDLFHRDIKPANILLDAAGVPSLADFGLALKDEDLGKGARQVGTATYMSPEQARGEGHRVDGRSDIFSLGIVLYELLTGRRPFRGSSRDQVMDQIVHAEPRPPRQIDDTIPRELERICLKALSKRASERYSTARDLAEDLRHFLISGSWMTSMQGVGTTTRTVHAETVTEPTPTPFAGSVDPVPPAIRIVPKGLGSFDENDADFFIELLPGPRDRGGLPDGLRFWKSRIEATDPDKTFRVGLIYGPSGCGKSSFVKAGLLPLLDRHITSVYVEATVGETEARLLRGVGRRFPDLPTRAGLVKSLTILRRDQGLRQNQKVLVVLDQFEQWLFAHRAEPATELVAALRQCDSEHLQALCLVRDDFWMAATRFMRDLEIDLVPDRNVAAVDLFDPKHARKVLAAYGRAYETLPPRIDDLTREQRNFLDQAVDGLAQDGRVVPVRLALFAEMVKRKPWTPATLRDVGGMDGVGVTFLEETFSSPRSSPNHRFHQKAAQAALKALLPESNADIKGRMRSIEELRGLSGYGDRQADFIDLIRILDSELRLITPVDLEGSIDEDVPAHAAAGRCYQLTHDYLVHALREWLTRKQRETRQGRAELLLADRTAQWGAGRRDRHLPSLTEWLSIRFWTRPKAWTEIQRRMMKRGRWVYGTRIFSLGLLIAFVTAITEAYSVYSRTQELLVSIPGTNVENLPQVLQRLAVYPRWVYSHRLRDMAEQSAHDPRSHFGYSLALLKDDPRQIEYLHRRLLEANLTEMAVLRDSLASYQDKLKNKLWDDLSEARSGDVRILPVAGVLAGYDSENASWPEFRDKVADALVKAKLDDVAGWRIALRNVRARLIEPLAKIFREKGPDHIEHELATQLLADYAADNSSSLVDVMLDADPKAFSLFFQVIQTESSQLERRAVLRDLHRELESSGAAPKANRPSSEKEGHQPSEGDMAAARRSARRARAAVALVRLGYDKDVWKLLEHNKDPEVRSYLINALLPYGADPSIIAEELERLGEGGGAVKEKNAYVFDPVISRRRALIQALMWYPKNALGSEKPSRLIETLIKLYRNDPDAGVHSSAELVLRGLGYLDRLRLDPGQPPRAGEPIRQRWYVNREGQTMVLIDGPVEFDMGSPPSEPTRGDFEPFHRRLIPRRFAIAPKEVNVESFQRFTLETRNRRHGYEVRYSPTSDCPQTNMTWYAATAYCNWLSEKENLRPCYLQNDKGEFAEGMRVDAEAVAAGGYRLPTQAEWEYACRAGTVTSRYFGSSPELLSYYEWYLENSAAKEGHCTHPCGSLLPNDLGLFDLLGNAVEWCHDRRPESALDPGRIIVDEILDEKVFRENRILRGSAFRRASLGLRSANQAWLEAAGFEAEVGFRVARTVP